VEDFENRFTDALSKGDIDSLIALIRPPLPVFYPEGVKVDVSYADVHDGLSHLVDGMRKLAIVRASSTILHVDQRADTGAIAYLVETQMLDRSGKCIRTALAKRYLELVGPEGYRMTMLDVQRVAIGILNGNRSYKFTH
jgi:hypothetical protein